MAGAIVAGRMHSIETAIFLIGLLFSMVLHEFGHMAAARLVRVPVNGFATTTGGMAVSVADEGNSKKQKIIVGFGGVAANTLIAALCYIALKLFPATLYTKHLIIFGFCNLIGPLQLIPLFRSDGARILRILREK